MAASKFASSNRFGALDLGLSDLSINDEDEHSDGSDDGEDSTVSLHGDDGGEEEDEMARFDREFEKQRAQEEAMLTSVVSKEQFKQGRARRFGTANPEIMDVPFCNAMVRTGMDPWTVRRTFLDKNDTTGEGICGGEEGVTRWSNPIWTNARHARSRTKLPNDTFVEIGGEYEDFYDPDFLIYNDVIVWHWDGEFNEWGTPKRDNAKFTIYGYPKDVFPPIDNHTATYVPNQNSIYIIGNLGYGEDRKERGLAYTSVFRLRVDTWEIQRVETIGEGPGAIWQHEAELKGNEIWVKSNGDVPDDFGDYCCTKREIIKDGKEETVNVTNEVWALDLDSLTWREDKVAVSDGIV